MKKLLILSWLILPLIFATYHFTKGEKNITQDQAQAIIEKAYDHYENEEYTQATDLFTKAIAKLTDNNLNLQRRLKLERAKARIQNSQLPKAREELQALIKDLGDDENADEKLLRDARSAFAYSRYYMTYLMKLESLPKEMWEPEIEAARQEYKLLAQQSQGDESQGYAQDLESTIRLARADTDDLTGRAIPQP